MPLLFSCGDWESPTYCHQCSEEINGAPYDSIKNPFDQNEYVYICSPRCMKDKQRKKNLQQNKKKMGDCPDCGKTYNKKTWGDRCPQCDTKKRRKDAYKATEHLRHL